MNLKAVWHAIKSISLVAVITIVIWLLAEGRTVQQQEVTLQLQFVSPAGEDPLLIEPQYSTSIDVLTRSTNTQVTLLNDLTRTSGPLTVVVSDDPNRELQSLDLADLLRSQKQLRDLGVEIISTTPAEQEVRIEAYESVTMAVEVVPGEFELAGPPTVDPAQVAIDVPASVEEKLRGRKLQAKLSRLPAQDLNADVDRTVELPLDLPPDLASVLTFENPRRARVTFRVRSMTRRATLELVPILVMAPPAQMAGIRVNLEDQQRVLRDVTISGPTKAVEQIEAGDTDVFAYVRLTAANLSPPESQESWTVSAPLTVNVPTGVIVESLVPVATVQLTRETATAAATDR